MTHDVVAVPLDMPFEQVNRILTEQRISAVPVVDDRGRILGVVSEANPLPRPRRGKTHRGLLSLLRWKRSVILASATAGDLMSSPATTIAADAPLVYAARLLGTRGIKQLPVIDEAGKLVGIVSCRDLLGVLLRADAEIADEIRHDVLRHDLWIDPATVAVAVRDGVVTLWGTLERKSLVVIAEAMVRRVDGVVDVVSQLTFILDDTRLKPTEPTTIAMTTQWWRHH